MWLSRGRRRDRSEEEEEEEQEGWGELGRSHQVDGLPLELSAKGDWTVTVEQLVSLEQGTRQTLFED
jgi:hypothetical protein